MVDLVAAHNEMPVSVSVDGIEWRRVGDLTMTGAEEKVFAVDANSGVVRFGDGTHGQRPPDGARISVTFVRGAGAAGHVAVSTSAADDDLQALERPQYYTGKLLTAADFEAEQAYVIGRLNRHNRLLHGIGIVRGLEVTAGLDGIVLSPGLALDRLGREIVIGGPQSLPLPVNCRAVLLLVSYAETLTGFESVLAGPAGDGTVVAARVKESFAWRYASVPAPDEVPVARLACVRGHWRAQPQPQLARRGWVGMFCIGAGLLALAGASLRPSRASSDPLR